MQGLVFSVAYVISLIIIGLSVFSSVLICKNNDKKWFLNYLNLVISISASFIINLIFYFIRYSYKPTELLEYIRIILMSLTYIFSSYLYLSLSFTVFEKQFVEKIKWLFFIITIAFNIIFAIMLFFVHWNFYNYINLVLIILCFIIDLKFIFNRKSLKGQNENILLLMIYSFIGLKVLYFLSYSMQYLFGLQVIILPNSVIYITYHLVLYSLNLNYSLKIFSKLKNIPKPTGESGEIPAAFIETYHITLAEKEVLELLIKGFLYKEIGGMRECSPRTVEKHVANVFEKCNVNNKLELFALVNNYKLSRIQLS